MYPCVSGHSTHLLGLYPVNNNDGLVAFRPLNTSTTSKRRKRSVLHAVAQHVPAENPLNPEKNCHPIG